MCDLERAREERAANAGLDDVDESTCGLRAPNRNLSATILTKDPGLAAETALNKHSLFVSVLSTVELETFTAAGRRINRGHVLRRDKLCSRSGIHRQPHVRVPQRVGIVRVQPGLRLLGERARLEQMDKREKSFERLPALCCA